MRTAKKSFRFATRSLKMTLYTMCPGVCLAQYNNNKTASECTCCVCVRGLKSTLWEGGVRAVGFIWSPLLHQSHYTSHHLMHITDWLPTLLHVVRNSSEDELYAVRDLDGVDQWDVLSNNLRQSRRTEILLNIDPRENASALRVDDMKLLFASRGKTRRYDGWYPTDEGRRDEDGTVLEGPNVPCDTVSEADMTISALHAHVKLNSSTTNVLRYIPHNNDRLLRPPFLNQEATQQRSVLASILEKIGRKPVYRRDRLVVKCGPRPSNASSSCKPWLEACLFNLTSDPCEYESLTSRQPDVVTAMQTRLQFYKDHAVAPLNKPVDDAGLPYHHHWNWVPWIKTAS